MHVIREADHPRNVLDRKILSRLLRFYPIGIIVLRNQVRHQKFIALRRFDIRRRLGFPHALGHDILQKRKIIRILQRIAQLFGLVDIREPYRLQFLEIPEKTLRENRGQITVAAPDDTRRSVKRFVKRVLCGNDSSARGNHQSARTDLSSIAKHIECCRFSAFKSGHKDDTKLVFINFPAHRFKRISRFCRYRTERKRLVDQSHQLIAAFFVCPCIH